METTLLKAQTVVLQESAGQVLAHIVEHMQEHDLAVRQEGELWLVDYEQGQGILWHEADGVHAIAKAPSMEALQDMKLMLAHLILEASGAADESLAWEGDGAALQRPPAFRLLTVLQVRDLTPHMRRVRFGCDDLARYAQDANIHCKLLFPQPGEQAPEWPTLSASGMLKLPQGSKRLDMRTYTIRAIDGAAGWLDVDFVLHEDAGPGSAWAANAQPGQLVGMSGPGGRTATPADWMLLAADDTGLPAMLRVAASLPAHVCGHVFAEVQDGRDEQAVVAPPGLQWHWLHRGQARAGSLLLPALRSVAWPAQGEGEGHSRFVWAAGEFEAAQSIRQWARDECGLEKGEQLVVAYWRQGMSEAEFKQGS
ncbi:siderophore-interacting protein [Comamonas composti]|uniref:siderophore-interacting protein n=1 Tax=Comamonas composti TaxID=408558 RepID=UPI000403AE60|nr:siderophore-interacting protein [Comamonas composti]